jgi:ATP-dependent helicase/nuclease subunit B
MLPVRKTTVLCGPPGSGKTWRVLDRFVACAAEHGHDSALLLLPTGLLANRTRERLVRDTRLPGLFDPRIMTFPALAQAILDANHEPVAPVADVQRRLIMADVLASLRAEGKLESLAEVSDLPGFPQSVCDFVDELKRAAVDAPRFRQAAQALLTGDEQTAALCDIYAEYQRRLTDLKLFDEPGCFWWARDLLREGRREPLSGLRLVLADGFSDFTTTQIQLLALLCQSAEEAIVTLPLEEDEGRQDLLDAPRATLKRLREHIPDAEVEHLPPPHAAHPPAAVARRVFSLAAPGETAGHIGNEGNAVQILCAPGQRAEVEQVAREVKTILLQDDMGPGDIGIVARNLGEYAESLRNVFREFGIPLYVSDGEPASRRPSVQIILDLLAIVADGYRRADVAKFLKSNFVCVDGLQPSQGPISPDDLERIACEARIIRGRDAWQQNLATRQRRLEAMRRAAEEAPFDEDAEAAFHPASEIEEELRLVERAGAFFGALAACLDELTPDGTRADHVRRVTDLIRRFGIPERLTHAGCPDDTAANVAAFSVFTEALAALANADEPLRAQEVPFARFAAEVRDVAASVEYMAPQWPEGRVVALDAHAARGMRFPVLFVMGLAEGAWPARRREGPFYDDGQRRDFAGRGVPLRTATERQAEEAFLFYLAVGSATERLYLTAPTVDAAGQPILPSHYLEEVLQLFPKDTVPQRQARLGDVIPAVERVCCPRELSERALLDLFRPPTDEGDATAYNSLIAAAPELARSMLHAALAERARDSLKPLDEFDGVLDDPAIAARLAERFGPRHVFSASQFGSYGSCPFQFFLERVLRLTVLEEPTEEVEALERGLIIHLILREFFREWQRDHDGQPITDDALADCQRRMAAIAEGMFAKWEHEGRVSHRKLWELTRDDVIRDLELLVEHESDKLAEQWVPCAFEAPYGFADVAPLSFGDGKVKVRGRIDRVDLKRDQEAGAERAFAVFDYKSGRSAPPSRGIEDGIDFQLPFYAVAAAQMLSAEGKGQPRCEEWAYYRVRRPARLWTRKSDPTKIDGLIETAVGFACQYAGRIRSGTFPVSPKRCGRYCDFTDVCRYSRYRIEKKGQSGGGPQ